MLSRLLEKIKFCHLKQTFKDYPYLTVNVHLVKTSTSEEEFKTFEVFLALQTMVQWIDYSNKKQVTFSTTPFSSECLPRTQ